MDRLEQSLADEIRADAALGAQPRIRLAAELGARQRRRDLIVAVKPRQLLDEVRLAGQIAAITRRSNLERHLSRLHFAAEGFEAPLDLGRLDLDTDEFGSALGPEHDRLRLGGPRI